MNLADKKITLQTEWHSLGQAYAKDINAMIDFGEHFGWENWKGDEPIDNREEAAHEVLTLLKKANKEGSISTFRQNFPPGYAPFINIIHEQGQNIENLCYIRDNTIAFIVGSAYEKRKAYLLSDGTLTKLRDNIQSIGRSPQGNIYAIAENGNITTYRGWEGNKVWVFKLPPIDELSISQIISFNNGLAVILISPEGIYLLKTNSYSLIHPLPDQDDKEWIPSIHMEHAALSADNSMIALGDQSSVHRILNSQGISIADVGPQSSYPHYALFSKNGQQLVLNSCHYYNGVTIGIPTAGIEGLKIEAHTQDNRYTVIDENCRVYAAVAISSCYIMGDVGGFIKAYDPTGKLMWRYFLGSTITGMSISDDEKTLWVAACSGMIHQLKLDKGQRDDHTIGDGNHYEEFRIIFWKNEPQPLIW
jgi:hypothetical protein